MENTQNTNTAYGERTFTQEEVNRIIGERLAKEKSKGDAASAEREQQLAERERQLADREALIELKEQLKEMGLPNELLPVLNVQDRAALNVALQALQKLINKNAGQKDIQVLPNRLQHGEPYGRSDDVQRNLRKAMGLSG